VDINTGVKILELIERGFCQGEFPHVFGTAVEIATHLLWSDFAGVEDGDLLGAGQDEVLGDFDSELNGGTVTPDTP
jgi:hypothetical protein